MVVDAYDVDLDAERGWDLSDIPSSNEISVRSSSWVGFTVTGYKGVEHSLEVLTTAARVFKLAIGCLNTLAEPREFFASVDRLHSAILSSVAQIQSVRRQTSSEPAKLGGCLIRI